MDTYYVSVGESAAGATKRHLALFNGSGSGKTMVVFRITAAATVATPTPLGARRLTAVPSGGTLLGFAKANPANAALPSQIQTATNVTGGTFESVFFAEGTTSIYEAPVDGSQQITCPEGTGFEVIQGTAAGTGSYTITAVIGLL